MKTKPFDIPKQQVMQAYRLRFRGKKTRAGQYLERMAKTRPGLFTHWRAGMTGVFA